MANKARHEWRCTFVGSSHSNVDDSEAGRHDVDDNSKPNNGAAGDAASRSDPENIPPVETFAGNGAGLILDFSLF
jgi:hypothetical protein